LPENPTETVRLLVVSREPGVLRPLWAVGEANAWTLESAASGWDAIERVQSGEAPHLLLLDLPRGDSDSLHILRWLRRLRPDLPVIVLCYSEDAAKRKDTMRLGAKEILVRPFDEYELETAIRRHLASSDNGEADIASENVEQLDQDALFISASPVMQRVRAQAELLAQADVPVLILGEGGSGKDTVARFIHKLSVRSGFKFLKVNCAAMPGDLLEAELFGGPRNSSAGAGRTNPGKFEVGEKSTIFLDEIAEMPLGLQSKLLQLLQNNELRRPGSEEVTPAHVRVLAASSANIDQALAANKLREDLYYRLSAFTVHVPPLRQRKDEMEILLRCAMHKLAKHYGLPSREFSPGVLAACQRYAWPGNLGELETFVKRYLVAGDAELTPGEIDLDSKNVGRDSSRGAGAGKLPGVHLGGGGKASPGPESLKSLIQNIKWEAERNAIGAALEKTGWNRKAAARLLRVSYRTLLYKIEQYHMRASERFLAARGESFFVVPDSEAKGSGKAS
jgi:two-component system, NtrC family, response regulator AtoC